MARKSSAKANPTAGLIANIDGPSLRLRPLSPSTQGPFLPGLLADAADHNPMSAYADRRRDAHQAFRQWIGQLRAGVFHDLNETQIEGDFNSKLLSRLGHTTSADVHAGQPWSMMA